MASTGKMIGYFFQAAGMLVMLFAFVMLVIGIQGITGSVTGSIGQSAGLHSDTQQQCTDAEIEEGTCEDLSTTEGLNAALEKRIIEFVKWLAAGIILTLIGFALRAGDEIGGFWARLHNKDKKRVSVGLRWGSD